MIDQPYRGKGIGLSAEWMKIFYAWYVDFIPKPIWIIALSKKCLVVYAKMKYPYRKI